MHEMPRRLPTARRALFAVLTIWLVAASADPFPWDEAGVETGALRLAEGAEVHYRAGSLWLGEHMEIAVALTWSTAAGPVEQEIVHTMADSPPKVSANGGILEVSWTIFPMGADAETSIATCWCLDAGGSAFVERPCEGYREAVQPDGTLRR